MGCDKTAEVAQSGSNQRESAFRIESKLKLQSWRFKLSFEKSIVPIHIFHFLYSDGTKIAEGVAI